jgi:formate--tetrahydrofolate ligase
MPVQTEFPAQPSTPVRPSTTTQPGLLPIAEIAEKLHLSPERYEPIGRYGAKVSLDLLRDPAFPARGRLILVTATTPTVSGEGKTVTSIGLTQGLAHIGKSVILTSREPSLGPVFGMKGGAAGGGRSQVEPAAKINLHFHGDFHAITSAHNLLAALIDSHLFHGNPLDIDPAAVTWPRTLDMNDRALRRIVVSAGVQKEGSKREGANRHSGFVITAASEVMAIVALAADRDDLRARLDRIVIGANRKGQPVTARDLNATGGMMALLAEALEPNLVQTTEGTPAFVHAGPFGNIAHGTSSIVSQQMGLRLADYVVNEAGFAADLGAEKYFDIVMRTSGIRPSVAVLVTTAQSLKQQGGGSLEAGVPNLARHVETLRNFRVPIVIAINHFPADTPEEHEFLFAWCRKHNLPYALSDAFTRGGEGTADLAQIVVQTLEENPEPTAEPIYTLNDSIEDKLRHVVQKVYGGRDVVFTDHALEKIKRYREWGFGNLPVCVAKTQYSLSDDPKLHGAPTGWDLHITDVALSAGAGFLVCISGNMMLMPGLPKVSRAEALDVDADGNVVGMS